MFLENFPSTMVSIFSLIVYERLRRLISVLHSRYKPIRRGIRRIPMV
jgi:hypothetical protein